jgi:hypothetical protein
MDHLLLDRLLRPRTSPEWPSGYDDDLTRIGVLIDAADDGKRRHGLIGVDEIAERADVY